MDFSQKVRAARKHLGLTMDQLAEMCGVSLRTMAYYELEGKRPKQKETARKLADALRVDVNVLLDDSADLPLAELSAEDEAARTAEQIVRQVRALYTGGALNPADMDEMMLAIQDAYWIAKRKKLRLAESEPDD